MREVIKDMISVCSIYDLNFAGLAVNLVHGVGGNMNRKLHLVRTFSRESYDGSVASSKKSVFGPDNGLCLQWLAVDKTRLAVSRAV